jgi:uncharacterized protein (DUF697 family)
MKSNKKRSLSNSKILLNKNLDTTPADSPANFATDVVASSDIVVGSSNSSATNKAQRVLDKKGPARGSSKGVQNLSEDTENSIKNSSKKLHPSILTGEGESSYISNPSSSAPRATKSASKAGDVQSINSDQSKVSLLADSLALAPVPSIELELVDSPILVNPSLPAVPATTEKMSPQTRASAEKIVRDHIPFAVGAGLLPIPGVDLAAITALQLKMLAVLAVHYRVAFTRSQGRLIVTSLIGSVGTTVLVGGALLSIAKSVPFFGGLIGLSSLSLAGGAITHAMGQLVIDHFETGGTMENFDLNVAQRAFAAKFTESKRAIS